MSSKFQVSSSKFKTESEASVQRLIRAGALTLNFELLNYTIRTSSRRRTQSKLRSVCPPGSFPQFWSRNHEKAHRRRPASGLLRRRARTGLRAGAPAPRRAERARADHDEHADEQRADELALSAEDGSDS